MSVANVHDSKMMLAIVDAIEPIRVKTRSRTRRLPHKLHADKGYDYRHLRLALRERRIIPASPVVCRAQEAPGTLPLGGRTDALLAQPLPAPIRYEHRTDIHLAFLQLGCALIAADQALDLGAIANRIEEELGPVKN